MFGLFSALLHTPGVCKRVHPLERRGACASQYLQCRETELNGRRGGACRRAENPEFKSSLSLPLLPALLFPSLPLSPSLALSLSLSLVAVNFSSFPLCLPPSLSLCLHAFSFCYTHKIDLLPAGVQTRAANVSTPKRKGETSHSRSMRSSPNFT